MGYTGTSYGIPYDLYGVIKEPYHILYVLYRIYRNFMWDPI